MMDKHFNQLRKDYTLGNLDENTLAADPFLQFEHWFQEALQSKIHDANAMVLATASSTGQPSARIVLLKGLSHEGFTFYTNYQSRKGTELQHNHKAALLFFWDALERQVRIEGTAEKVEDSLSDEYFNTRPLMSRIGAIASPQSQPIDKNALQAQVDELSKLPETEIKRPEHWGGFNLKPHYFEFWQGRASRLHDRIVYEPDGIAWKQYRIAP
ncbi:MAG: pyridoxamine 5'-phosphate oxidase [Chitinophagales bacterium]|nr:pyridoxamine 5'-phosphate oxidase [Chitinophagales bacterium]